MSRLTNKDYKDWWHPVGAIINEQSSVYLNEVNHKLGKLEDLEDELGCPLDVVFKAIKYGVRTKFLDRLNNVSLYYNEEYSLVVFNDFGSNVYVKLKDYKKTWWLKEDMSE